MSSIRVRERRVGRQPGIYQVNLPQDAKVVGVTIEGMEKDAIRLVVVVDDSGESLFAPVLRTFVVTRADQAVHLAESVEKPDATPVYLGYVPDGSQPDLYVFELAE